LLTSTPVVDVLPAPSPSLHSRKVSHADVEKQAPDVQRAIDTVLTPVSTSVNSSAATQSDVFTDPTPGSDFTHSAWGADVPGRRAQRLELRGPVWVPR
jgi:hypothetical protein